MDGAREFVRAARVHNVLRSEPAAPRRDDAVAHAREALGMMRVRGDGELRAFRLGRTDHRAMKVEALRTAVDFQPYSPAYRLRRDTIEVERKAVALQQAAAGRVPHDAKMRALERAQQTVSHLLRREVHVTMYA